MIQASVIGDGWRRRYLLMLHAWCHGSLEPVDAKNNDIGFRTFRPARTPLRNAKLT